MNTREENLNQFFGTDGKTVILPIDHGTEATIDFVDAYVVNLGVALAANELFDQVGLCLRTDCYKPAHGSNEDEGSFRIYGIPHAEMIGANAVMNMLYVHHCNEAEIFREAADLIGDSLEADIPVILEALPFGIGRPADYTPENIGFAVRIAAELGADVVKTAFPTNGTVDDFKKIVDACFVPVIVLGGAAMGDDRALLSMVRKAMDAGAAGIAVGRNVWQHSNPAGIAEALNAIVHEDDSVDAALNLIS
jgi:DhnA family fructose-bisphosphate aldolase class Ia